MYWLVRRLRSYNPVAIRLTGFFWLTVAGNTLLSWFSPSSNPIIDLFGHESSVLFIFSVLCFLRGAMGLFNPKLYWQTFRAGLFITQHNEKRFLFLVICACAWIALSIIENIFIPSWILLWGFGAWLLLAFPYKLETENTIANDWLFEFGKGYRQKLYPDERLFEFEEKHPQTNPATGLPMMDMSRDTQGNPYGWSNW